MPERLRMAAETVFELPHQMRERSEEASLLAHAIEPDELVDGEVWAYRLAPYPVRCPLPSALPRGAIRAVHVVGAADVRVSATTEGLGKYRALLTVVERPDGPRPIGDDEWTDLIENPGRALCSSGWRASTEDVARAFLHHESTSEPAAASLALGEMTMRGASAWQAALAADLHKSDRKRLSTALVRGVAVLHAADTARSTVIRARPLQNLSRVSVDRRCNQEGFGSAEAVADWIHLLDRRVRGEWLLLAAERQVDAIERSCEAFLRAADVEVGRLVDVLEHRRAVKRRCLVGIDALEADEEEAHRPFEPAWRGRVSQVRGRLESADEALEDLQLLFNARIAAALWGAAPK